MSIISECCWQNALSREWQHKQVAGWIVSILSFLNASHSSFSKLGFGRQLQQIFFAALECAQNVLRECSLNALFFSLGGKKGAESDCLDFRRMNFFYSFSFFTHFIQFRRHDQIWFWRLSLCVWATFWENIIFLKKKKTPCYSMAKCSMNRYGWKESIRHFKDKAILNGVENCLEDKVN